MIRICILFFSLIFGGPSIAQDAGKSDTSKKTQPVVNNYRLIVGFTSFGAGTDSKARMDLDRFIESYAKKLKVEKIAWGKEGESDYCFKLSELSASEQNDFVKKVRDLLSVSKQVRIEENVPCSHKN